MTRIGDLLREHRERAGLSQAELASMTGIHPKTISHYETGVSSRRPIGPAAANALVRALPSLSIYELLEAAGYEFPTPAVPRDILAMLGVAPPPVQDAVRLTLRGWLASQRERE